MNNPVNPHQGSLQNMAAAVFSFSLGHAYTYIFNNLSFLSYLIQLLHIGVVMVVVQLQYYIIFGFQTIKIKTRRGSILKVYI